MRNRAILYFLSHTWVDWKLILRDDIVTLALVFEHVFFLSESEVRVRSPSLCGGIMLRGGSEGLDSSLRSVQLIHESCGRKCTWPGTFPIFFRRLLCCILRTRITDLTLDDSTFGTFRQYSRISDNKTYRTLLAATFTWHGFNLLYIVLVLNARLDFFCNIAMWYKE